MDRQKAASMKLSVSKIAKTLQTVLSGTSAGYYREAGDEYRILVKLKDSEKRELRDILDLPVTNSEGDRVVLRNVVRIQPTQGPVLIERKAHGLACEVFFTENFREELAGFTFIHPRQGV